MRVRARAAGWPAVRRFARSPKGLLIEVLTLFALVAAPQEGGLPALLSVALAAAAAGGLDLVLVRLGDEGWKLPDGAILTGLIVGEVLDPHLPLYVPVLAALAAIVTKYIFRTRWSNIFNPAAAGLLFVYFLGGGAQSWWGGFADLPWPLLIALVAAGVFFTHRENKWPLLLTFLGGYAALLTAVTFFQPARVMELFRVPDLNAALFFGFFMVTDPPTSPVRYERQVQFGLITAVAAVVVYLALGAVYYLLVGLLLANAWESWMRAQRPAGKPVGGVG